MGGLADRGVGMARMEGAAERFGLGVAAAMLSLCIVAGDRAEAQEQPPAPPGGDNAVLLEADTVTSDEENQRIVAEGKVEARYGGRTLRADRLIYDMAKRSIRAQGRVELIEADGSVRFAREVEVGEDLSAGVAADVAARLPGGGTLVAGSAVRRPDGASELTRLIYTACPICEEGEGKPTWTLRARKAVQDPENNLITYRNAILSLKGVPVLYLPYFAHPDPSAGRRSGLLTPDIGRNSRTGFYYTQPYLWTVDRYTDLTIAPQAFARVNPLLNLDLRRRFYSGAARLSGSITYDRNFDNQGDRFGDRKVRGHIFGTGAFRISDNWDWGFGVARTTDDLYLRRYDIAGAATRRALYGGDITRLFSQVNVIGQSEDSYTEISAISFQGLRSDDSSATTPTALPVGETERLFRDPLFDGLFRLRGSTAIIRRTGDEIDSSRLSLGFRYDIDRAFGPGIIASPFLEGRSDGYTISREAGDPDSLIRSYGVAGVEVRWPFVRPGDTVDLLIEPEAMIAYGSANGNDPRIPNEDSISFELDESSLFRANAAPNYDVAEPGARASFGLRAAATTTVGSLAAVFGRRWREEAEPELFDIQSNLNDRASDWVGGVDADFGRNFGGNVRFRVGDDLELKRIDASARASLWRLSASARYFNVSDELSGLGPSSEITGDVLFQLGRRWSAGYALRRDLDSDVNLSQGARVLYRDDCMFVEVSYTREEISDRSLGPGNTFLLRVGLNTLGVLGTDNARNR